MSDNESSLGIIAGKGAYPLELAASARAQGVQRLVAVAFRKETRPAIASMVDAVTWLKVGQLQAMLDAFKALGVNQVVMAGQITPTHLFRLRPDRKAISLLLGLKERNAHTIFGAIADELAALGITLRPASLFMERALAVEGVLTARGPTEREAADIAHGLGVARATSALEIGQTVVLKEGTILAVEAFEGTDRTIRRGGKLGGSGAVAVKVAKPGHDMRFDIPVIGLRTIRALRRAEVSALAIQAGRCIVLEREQVIALADNGDIAIVAVTENEETE